MKKEMDVFSVSKVAMDNYKNKFDNAKTRKEKRFEDLNRNFIKGSPMFVQERDRIMPEFSKEIETARDESLKAFEDALEKAIACERAHVMIISSSTKEMISVLNCLENSSISVDEYRALVESHGNKSYWIDRFLERLAAKNDIYETGVQPSFTVKLEILDKLARNTKDYLNNYDGEHKTFPVTSSDAYIYKLEEKYTNGYSGIRMSDRETAKRLVEKALRKGDSLKRSVSISNILRTTKPDMQNEILSILSESDNSVLLDPVMTGVKKVVDRFKKENSQNIKLATAAIDKINSAKSHQERMGIIWDNLDNKHFRKMIEEKIATKNDEKLKESYETALEVKREKSQKAPDNRE